jgi:hypothetical protein
VAKSANTILTATYWEFGRRIVEFEQAGKKRAEYGKGLLKQLSKDLSNRCGRGFSVDTLELMRMFYLTYLPKKISESLPRKFDSLLHKKEKSESVIRILSFEELSNVFELSWTHYVQLLRRVESGAAKQSTCFRI